MTVDIPCKSLYSANGISAPPQPGLLRNPIVSGFNPDPSIVRVGNDYFLATSTFEYYPGVPIYHKDLTQWSLIGHCLTSSTQLNMRVCEASMGIFAPTLRFWRGKFYMTTMAMHKKPEKMQSQMSRGFYVTTDNIWDSSSWSDPVYYDVLGIDQDLFFDDSKGKVWLAIAKLFDDDIIDHTGYPIGVYIGEIDLDTGCSLSEFQLVRRSEKGNGIAEGPHVFKRGNYYYMITAEGGTEIEHQEWVMRSKESPLGPWEVGAEGSVNPMIFNGDHSEIRQTGHMDMVEGADGRWWAVFLAVRPVHDGTGKPRLSQLGRETFLAPVEWHDDWPVVHGRQPLSINTDVPGLLRTSETFREEIIFAPKMDLARKGWYRMRTPVKIDYSLSEQPGALTLYGSPYAITADEAPTMFLRKQLSFQGHWSVDVDAVPQRGHEAGVAIWWSKYSYASVAIRGKKTGRELVYRFPNLVNDEFEEAVFALGDEGPLSILINAQPTGYDFSYRTEKERRCIGSLTSALLVRTRPFDSIMTGTHLALWASGARDQGSLRPAHFRNVTWEGVRAGGQ